MTTIATPRHTAALHAEWIKLSTVRSNRLILGLTAAIGIVTSFAVAKLVTDEVLVASTVFTYATVLTAVLAAVAGILVFTSETQHGTLALASTARPARSSLVLAKAVTAATFGAAVGATGLLAGFAGALLGGLEVGDTASMLTTTAWGIFFVAVTSVFGLGIGMAARHSAAAISGFLVWWLVLENLVFAFTSQRVSRFLPFFAGGNLLGIEADGSFAQDPRLALSSLENALVFGGYAALSMVVGAVLFHRRDVT